MDKNKVTAVSAVSLSAAGMLVFGGLWAVTLQDRDALAQENASLTQDIAAWNTQDAEFRQLDADLATREQDVAAREAEVQRRESEVSATSQLAAEEAWVGQVRECLARPGEYINASVSNSSVLGVDFTCFSG